MELTNDPDREEKSMTVEVTVKMSMKVNTNPRKWFEKCLSEWMDNVLELDEELVDFQIDIEEKANE